MKIKMSDLVLGGKNEEMSRHSSFWHFILLESSFTSIVSLATRGRQHAIQILAAFAPEFAGCGNP
jgi:hypothetical protein